MCLKMQMCICEVVSWQRVYEKGNLEGLWSVFKRHDLKNQFSPIFYSINNIRSTAWGQRWRLPHQNQGHFRSAFRWDFADTPTSHSLSLRHFSLLKLDVSESYTPCRWDSVQHLLCALSPASTWHLWLNLLGWWTLVCFPGLRCTKTGNESVQFLL